MVDIVSIFFQVLAEKGFDYAVTCTNRQLRRRRYAVSSRDRYVLQVLIQHIPTTQSSNAFAPVLAKSLRDAAYDFVNRTQREPRSAHYWLATAIAVMEHTYNLPTLSNDDFAQSKAMCAWEIAKFYELGLNEFRIFHRRKKEVEQKILTWMQRSAQHDIAYTAYKFKHSPRRGVLIQLFEQHHATALLHAFRTTYVRMSVDELTPVRKPPTSTSPRPAEKTITPEASPFATVSSPQNTPAHDESTPIPPPAKHKPKPGPRMPRPSKTAKVPAASPQKPDHPEITPIPPATESIQTPYDPEYRLSSIYHVQFARVFASKADWRKALAAWDRAIYLFPRLSYRKQRLTIMTTHFRNDPTICRMAKREANYLRKLYAYDSNTVAKLNQIITRLQSSGGCREV